MCRTKVWGPLHETCVSLLKRAALHNISSVFRMKPQDLPLQSRFAKEIFKIRRGDGRSFFFEGIMKSAADTISEEVSPSGCTGLFFRFFRCVCTGVLKVKADNCLCSWVGRYKLIYFYQPGATWDSSCVILECDRDRLFARHLGESFSV